MKNTIFLLLLCNFVICGAGIARAVDVQTRVIEQSALPPTPDDKKPANVGPRNTAQEKKQHGVGVNVFLNKNMVVSGSLAVLSPEPSILSNQSDESGMVGMGLRASQVGGSIGFKLLF